MIYKPTDLSPSAQTFDVMNTPIFFECKVDTSNVTAAGFTIKVLDSENNVVFSSIPEGEPLNIQYITLINDLRTYVNDKFPAYVLGDTLINTGYNGTYLKIPFSVAFEDKAEDNDSVANSQIYYSSTETSDSKLRRCKDGGLVKIYNGQEYKWSITLYQLEGDQVPENPVYYDMPLTTGTVLGSNDIRIQSVLSYEIYSDYFIQPVLIDGLKYDPNKPESWTYNTDESDPVSQNKSNRVLIKSYDPTYGYIYPMVGETGFATGTIVPDNANGFRIYKRGNNIEDLNAYQQVLYVCDEPLDEHSATSWSQNRSYESGDFVYYESNGLYYKCTNDISSSNTPPNSDSGHWAEYSSSLGVSLWRWITSEVNAGESYGELVYWADSDPAGLYDIPNINIQLQGNERIVLNHQLDGQATRSDNYLGSPYNGIYFTQFKSEEKIEGDLSKYLITVRWIRTPDADSWGELMTKIVTVTSSSSRYFGRNIQINDINDNSDAYGTINETPFLFVEEKPIEIYKNNYPAYVSGTIYNEGDVVSYIKSGTYPEFNNSSSYSPGEIVYTTSNSAVTYYICIQQTTVDPNVEITDTKYWLPYKVQSYYICKSSGTTDAPIKDEGAVGNQWSENPYLGNTGVIFYNNALGTSDRISSSDPQSTHGRLYIRHFDGLQAGMVLFKTSTNNIQEYVKIKSYNPDYNFITYDKLYTYNTYEGYSNEDPKNPTSKESDTIWSPADSVGKGTKYQIKTFFRESDESAFYFYTTPEVSINFESANGKNFVTGKKLEDVQYYNSTESYPKDTIVTHNGIYYVALTSVPKDQSPGGGNLGKYWFQYVGNLFPNDGFVTYQLYKDNVEYSIGDIVLDDGRYYYQDSTLSRNPDGQGKPLTYYYNKKGKPSKNMGDIVLGASGSSDADPDLYYVKKNNNLDNYVSGNNTPPSDSWEVYRGPLYYGDYDKTEMAYHYNDIVFGSTTGQYFICKNVNRVNTPDEDGYRDEPQKTKNIGAYSSSIKYKSQDIVLYKKSYYINTSDNTPQGSPPGVNSNYWDLYSWQIYIPEITERTLVVTADYEQQQYVQWKSAQWFLYDGNGENILDKSEVLYDGKLQYVFRGLDGRQPNSNKDVYYIVRLILETYNGYRLTVDRTIETVFNVQEISSEGLIETEFDCDTMAVKTTITKEAGYIVPDPSLESDYVEYEDAEDYNNGEMTLGTKMSYEKVAFDVSDPSYIDSAVPLTSVADRFILQSEYTIMSDNFAGNMVGISSAPEGDNSGNDAKLGDFRIYLDEIYRVKNTYDGDEVLEEDNPKYSSGDRNTLKYSYIEGSVETTGDITVVDGTDLADLKEYDSANFSEFVSDYKDYEVITNYQPVLIDSGLIDYGSYYNDTYYSDKVEYEVTRNSQGGEQSRDTYLVYKNGNDINIYDVIGNKIKRIQTPLLKKEQYVDPDLGVDVEQKDFEDMFNGVPFDADAVSSNDVTSLLVRGATTSYWNDYECAVPNGGALIGRGRGEDDVYEDVYMKKNVQTIVGWKWKDFDETENPFGEEDAYFWSDGDYSKDGSDSNVVAGEIFLNNQLISQDIIGIQTGIVNSEPFFKPMTDINIENNTITSPEINRKNLDGITFVFDLDLTMESTGVIRPTEKDDEIGGKLVAYYYPAPTSENN